MASCFLGLDVGTSSTKVLLIDATGKVLASSAPEYAFRTPRPLWAEADPEDWWKATLEGIRNVLAATGKSGSDIAGIGLSGQMHGLVMLDAQGRVLRPCIMWNDQRTASQCAELTAKAGLDKVLAITGNPILPGFTAGKILWVRQNEPEVYARCAKVLLPKDYIRYRLSGVYASEVSDASGTSLLDVPQRKWSSYMLDAAGIPASWMPELSESPDISSHLSAEAAALTGLLAGTPIAGGGGDQAARAVGCGIVEEGLISATFGTSGVVFAHSRQYRGEPEGKLHAFCAAVPGEWHLMGVMLSAAGSLQWFRDALGHEEVTRAKAEGRHPYALFDEMAAGIPAGSDGLIFLPYLSGERTPHPDPYARGAFVGLTLRHGKAHMVRSVLEGITYGMLDSVELMRALGIRSRTIVASGGGARSALWRQMMADMFETPIALVNATEGAAYGAALLAAVGTGAYPDVRTAAAKCIATNTVAQAGADAAYYRKAYPRYRALYPALKNEFRAIADLG
ncbi:MAG: xylulokinase [Opitutales bacterium]|jgi:xylulokinase